MYFLRSYKTVLRFMERWQTKKTDMRHENWDLSREAEIFYKMVISNIFVLSYALTYKYELTLMVGASLRLASRQESFQDSRVSALTSEGRVGAIPLELQGMDSANSLFINKQGVSYCCHSFWFT